MSDDSNLTPHRQSSEEEDELLKGPEDVVEVRQMTPHGRRKSMHHKSNAAFGGFLSWVVFVIIWLFFFAGGFGIFENMAVVLSSFFVTGGVIGAIWSPGGTGSQGTGWRINVSIMSGVIWLAFIILWLPFFMEGFSLYQNIAVIVGSTLLLLLVNSSSWVSAAPTIDNIKKRTSVGSAVFFIWIVISIYWLWFQADAYVWEQNFALGLLSTLIVLLIETGVFRSAIGTSKDMINPYIPIGLLFVWMAVLFVWFWFFGEPYNVYQNFAVFLASMMLFAGIGYLYTRNSGILLKI
ncbi:MAG: hypothetical protein R6V83_08250 [Candidatus Thorarchaeota archaeon]